MRRKQGGYEGAWKDIKKGADTCFEIFDTQERREAAGGRIHHRLIGLGSSEGGGGMGWVGWAGGKLVSEKSFIEAWTRNGGLFPCYFCFVLHDMPGFSLYISFPCQQCLFLFFCMAAVAWRGSGKVHRKAGACGLLFIIVIRHRRRDEETRGWLP